MSKRYFKVVIPTNADRLFALTNRILQKHQQDGATSKLSPTLADQLQTQLNTARTENERRNELDRQKEKLNEERNLILGLHDTQNSFTEGTVRYFLAAARDILLGQYRGNERVLGDWGYVVNSPKGAVQVIIPRRTEPLVALAKSVLQKHYNDGANSLLSSLNLDNLQQRLYEAEQKLNEAGQTSRDKEKATQTRNIALGIDRGQNSKTPNTVAYMVRSVRDVLLGSFRGREQELGAWGFEVNASVSEASYGSEP